MANYHLEVSIISRRKGRSVVKSVNYIIGRKLHDHYNNKTYYNRIPSILQGIIIPFFTNFSLVYLDLLY